MRVRNAATKVTLVLVGYALAVIIGVPVAVSASLDWGVMVSSVIVLLLVVILTRVFRGENESDAPRSWWRMTARPTASYVLAAFFFLQTIGSMSSTMFDSGSVGWVPGVVSLIIAVAYVNSAIRLTAIDRPHKTARA